MVMRGFELLLIAHLVYIQVPSGSTLSTSPSTYTTYLPEPLIRQTAPVPTTPVPTTPVHTSPPPTSPPPTSPPPPVQTTPVPTTPVHTSPPPTSPPPTSPPPTSPPPTTASVQLCGLDDPCQPGGYCRNTTSGYTCICSLGYEGDNCSIACNRSKIDLLLIEDASPSVTKTEDYDAMKEFETKLINDSRIDLSAIHVAEVVFGEEAKLGFYLNTFHNKASLQAAIAKSSKEGGPTHLVKPILLADLDVFIGKHGDRTDAKNVVVLFTDGRSRDGGSLYKVAPVLKKKALVFVVALTNEQDLANIASVGSGANNVFTDKKEALKAISDALAATTCR